MSDPAGGELQYTSNEIAALGMYAQEGHNIFGTYLLLQFERFLNHPLTQGKIVYHLIHLNKACTSKASRRIWQEFYAQELIAEYA